MAMLMTYQRVEVITGSEKRRFYSAADKPALEKFLAEQEAKKPAPVGA